MIRFRGRFDSVFIVVFECGRIVGFSSFFLGLDVNVEGGYGRSRALVRSFSFFGGERIRACERA